ncbi:hypothetical protein QWZ08_05640 [Ferruginibacter paludis]|uniref:hypothetical protein n=1 Tax=Ferruginibacter paludis TaxID=1310417 RepID=UPI0025B4C109|nr:hypothetical protein [Ferruginibacter paludis]MDN3655097.1 hypothetical protein [Ferruginibacter paludis]
MHFKITILLLLLFACFCNHSFAQSENAKIKAIQQVYNRTNQITGFKKIMLENEAFLENVPDGGGSLTGYFKKGMLYKIKEWIGLSYGVVETEYYLSKNTLVFAYVKERHFKTVNDKVDYKTTIPAYEGRFYFDQSKLLRTIRKGKGMWDSGQESILSLHENAKRYIDLLYKKNKGY